MVHLTWIVSRGARSRDICGVYEAGAEFSVVSITRITLDGDVVIRVAFNIAGDSVELLRDAIFRWFETIAVGGAYRIGGWLIGLEVHKQLVRW